MALQLTSEQYNIINNPQTVPLPNGDVKIINKNGKFWRLWLNKET